MLEAWKTYQSDANNEDTVDRREFYVDVSVRARPIRGTPSLLM